MSLPGSQHAVGTDGSDYQHRECIAPHYRASIESKSRLRLLIYSHFLLGFLVFVHILTYHTSLMSTLNVPRPHLWQYIWLNSILSSICGLVSINKNRIFLMKIFFRGTVIFGLGTIITTIIINLSELFTFKKLKTNHQLDELEPQTFFGFPLLSAYSLIADNNNNNNNNNQQCTKDSCSSITSSTYYVLYDVNHGEGFNLRRDVYIRMANLIHTLRERKSADSNWILVLPPWGPLYHWFSHNLPRTQLKWSNFFDIKSLSRFIPVIEFEDFLQLFTSSSSSSSSTSQITIPYVYTLQHFSEGWGENFEEKLEIRKCNEEPMYEKRNDNYYYGWFFGYDDRIRARQFQCLSAQGFVTVLVDFLIQNITWSDDRNKEQVVKNGGKAIVDQWICAHARYFIGSYESTFSFRIQEDREILGFEQDSTFNRLCGDHEVLLIISLIAIYWFQRKPTLSKPDDIQQTIRNFRIDNGGVKGAGASHEGSFVDRMIHSNKKMVVFYGSQTGTAEDFAQRIAKQAKRYGISAAVCDPEECDMEELQRLIAIDKHLALFCLATYGEGDPTDNAQEFYEWLRENGRDLTGLHYAVFGLGNKTYEHYNAVGKLVDKRITELGGVRVCDLGLGDDDGNIEDDFMAWATIFWQNVCHKYELVINTDGTSMRQYKLVPGPFPVDSVFTGEIGRLKSYERQKPPYDARNPYLAPVTNTRELFQNDCLRSCLHLELDISATNIKYEAGYHVGVFPSNDAALVNRVGELLDVNLDEIISLLNVDEDAQKKYPFPCPCSYRTALTYYLDLTSMPNTQILKEIAQYATDENDKTLLTLMGSYSEEGKIQYKEWILDSCRSIVAILEDLPSLKPPLDHLCELLPRLHPRYYSISSSPKVHPTSIHITAVIVHFETPTKRVAKGVATNCFKELYMKHQAIGCAQHKEGDTCHLPGRLPIFIRKSTFRLPFRFQTPIIMIGPGTGLAPFRGFIQERHFFKNQVKPQGKPVGETILYYGCRNRAEDYLYEEELNYFVKENVLELHIAFSRDQEEKIYVTHLLKDHGAKLWKLIKEDNASVYVCGDAKNMARDVHSILIDIAQTYGNMTSERAAAFIKDLIQKERYSQDVWS
ncbi:unnamed protein product [Rotaria magnacalcarata]|uniref:NADPH--cytochrome P450 reductase n=1 Tax=Rotaria magnacalcarata TaxID=392030 RepID=A0A8S2LX94_9BILA|nr:unnamed protein product [Rotaria magnacalcarata]